MDKNNFYIPIVDIEYKKDNVDVFNLQVSKDESYVVPMMAVHNCGYVVGESLLCFLPVVTTFSKSIAEWWKLPDVNFIQQNDADMLADILSKDELYHEAKEGRKAVVEKYSNEVIGQNYIDMMEEVI